MRPAPPLLLLALALTSCASAPPRPTVAKPADINTILTHQNALAAKINQLKREDRNACVADELGCGDRSYAPLACEGELGVKASGALPPGFERYEATPVALRGKLLSDSMCTMMYCGEDACCNSCGGQLVLELADGQRVALEPPEAHQMAFRCIGDESMTCCGYKADGRVVVVSGDLKGEQDAGPRISGARLCTP